MASAQTMTAAMPVPAAAPADDRIDPRRLVAFLAMVFGMFMAILDIQIVSASLTEIQAGLAASADEISWVQTAYLIAEVVMIPLSGFLSRALGTRIAFAGAAAGFTAASVMCGLSTSISEMIFWRAVQGFIGGGMIPTVFATAFIIFPRSRLAFVSPMIGLVATLAPTIGPIAFARPDTLESSPITMPSRPLGLDSMRSAVNVDSVPPMANPVKSCQNTSHSGLGARACGK